MPVPLIEYATMFATDRVRRWAQANPQLAVTLASFMLLAAFAGATGDLANLDGSGGWGPFGGTTTHQGP
jgi:hypothetical protein